jgi:hypothetical protein
MNAEKVEAAYKQVGDAWLAWVMVKDKERAAWRNLCRAHRKYEDAQAEAEKYPVRATTDSDNVEGYCEGEAEPA